MRVHISFDRFQGLLTSILGDNNSKFNMDRDAVAKVTQQCNMYVS